MIGLYNRLANIRLKHDWRKTKFFAYGVQLIDLIPSCARVQQPASFNSKKPAIAAGFIEKWGCA